MIYKVGSISQVHQQLVENGYHISQCALRRWVKQGVLPATYSGSKALISYEKVLCLLDATPTGIAG